jgi:hypothetical protein
MIFLDQTATKDINKQKSATRGDERLVLHEKRFCCSLFASNKKVLASA